MARGRRIGIGGIGQVVDDHLVAGLPAHLHHVDRRPGDQAEGRERQQDRCRQDHYFISELHARSPVLVLSYFRFPYH